MELNKVCENIYQYMKKGSLITAGTIDKYNTMTIGWGVTGVLWGKNVFIAYVRPSRYTYQFMENNDYFTISYYDDSYKSEIAFLGKASGRDIDKVKEVGFNPISVGESVSFEEAKLTVLCKKIYIQDLDQNNFPEDVNNRYFASGDVHRYYIGEIIDVIEK